MIRVIVMTLCLRHTLVRFTGVSHSVWEPATTNQQIRNKLVPIKLGSIHSDRSCSHPALQCSPCLIPLSFLYCSPSLPISHGCRLSLKGNTCTAITLYRRYGHTCILFIRLISAITQPLFVLIALSLSLFFFFSP